MGYTPPYLDVRKVAGAYNVYAPSSTTTDDITIYPNTTDSYGRLTIYGGGGVYLYAKATFPITFVDETGGSFLVCDWSTPDTRIKTNIVDNNIALIPNGTGKVKFGTYTAGAATDSTGYITILDAAGNTRKLMVQA